MNVQLDVPETLYRAAAELAAGTGRPAEDVLRQALMAAWPALAPHPDGGTGLLERRAAAADPDPAAALAVLDSVPAGAGSGGGAGAARRSRGEKVGELAAADRG